ncbi:MAG: 3-isopropylmalate dehydratase small subunit [Planctomycetes bacterium]|nr:3-isopropylmalate dehydratase small subunit [Planctomycetota bacterium]MCW8136741.1 3-isopropylmalate dehydratase small subunit [Planctomycetota bacterium]
MPFETIVSRCVTLDADDVDTDQIIPARFLSGVDRDGLGRYLFYALRHRPDGTPDPYFALNRAASRGARILVAGRNFGCGSSREHAVWALLDWGFRVVIAPSFADIFSANALKNGLLPVALPLAAWRVVHAAAEANQPVLVDLAAGMVRLHGQAALTFAIDGFARRCLLEGVDEFGWLLARLPAISSFERGRP